MANPFDSVGMAAGYATSRPPVHPKIIDRLGAYLNRRLGYVLDVGCGAGLSTAPLSKLAENPIGMEPAESMLRWTGTTAPGASFLAGRAEALPVRSGWLDAITAAGSLNYCDLNRFFPEARRVLKSDGSLAVYDFSQGRSFANSNLLDDWFETFLHRYPKPESEAQTLNPEILAEHSAGFSLRHQELFAIALPIAPAFYLEYILTETNVAAAIRRGESIQEIRAWCAESLAPVFHGRAHDTIFRGYIAILQPLVSVR